MLFPATFMSASEKIGVGLKKKTKKNKQTNKTKKKKKKKNNKKNNNKKQQQKKKNKQTKNKRLILFQFHPDKDSPIFMFWLFSSAKWRYV